MTYTIAISGTSGAGKTSLARAVAERLNATVLHFDDYEFPDATLYPDFEGWIARGLPVATHAGTTLAGEVGRLRAGQSIRRPKAEDVISPAPYLVIEEPFGRARPAIAPLIDLAVVIATPAEIALARRLARDLAPSSPGRTVEQVLTQARGYLEWYAAGGHGFYERMVGLAKAGADLIVDGRLPLADLAQTVADHAIAADPHQSTANTPGSPR
jgi:uridine kinase